MIFKLIQDHGYFLQNSAWDAIFAILEEMKYVEANYSYTGAKLLNFMF